MITKLSEFKLLLERIKERDDKNVASISEAMTTKLKDVTYEPIMKMALAVADHLGLNIDKLKDNATIKIWGDDNFKVENTGGTISFYYVRVSDDEQKLMIDAENAAQFTIDNPNK